LTIPERLPSFGDLDSYSAEIDFTPLETMEALQDLSSPLWRQFMYWDTLQCVCVCVCAWWCVQCSDIQCSDEYSDESMHFAYALV
jgi:hypothetical protein